MGSLGGKWSTIYETVDLLGNKKNILTSEAKYQIPGLTRIAPAAIATRDVVGSYVDYKTEISHYSKFGLGWKIFL